MCRIGQSRRNIFAVLVGAVVVLAIGFGCLHMWWAHRAGQVVDPAEWPDFKPIGTNEQARERDVSFHIVVGRNLLLYRKSEFDSVEALDAALAADIKKAELTSEEASRAPVGIEVEGRAPYGKVAAVLSSCARHGLKTVAFWSGVEQGDSTGLDGAVSLPVVAHGVPVDLENGRPRNWIVLDVRKGGQVYVNGEGPYVANRDTVQPSALKRRIVEAAGPFEGCSEGAPLLFRADEQAPTGVIRLIMGASACSGHWGFYMLGRLADGRTCIISKVEETCPNGFWWGDGEEPEELPEKPIPPVVRETNVDGRVWSYVVEKDGTASIWGGRDPNRMMCSLCAVNPQPKGALVVPGELDGYTVAKIEESAFGNCFELTSVQLPGGIRRIGSLAFSNCRQLVTLVLPDSTESIGYSAFSGSGLTHLRIPAGVLRVDHETFNNMPSLRAIEVDEDNPNYRSMDGVLYNKDCTRVVRVPQTCVSVTLPSTVRELGTESFSCCSITNAVLPPSLRYVSDRAFASCERLRSVSFAEGLTELPWSVFRSCSELRSVRLPDSLEQIGNYAFEGCSSLSEITLPPRCRHLDFNAFADCTGLTSVRMPDDTSFVEWRCFEGVPSSCVFSLGPFWRYKPDLLLRVPSPLGWSILSGILMVLFITIRRIVKKKRPL